MKCDKRDLLLYAVTDRSWSEGTTLGAQVEEALRGGATFVQLREKKLTGEALRAEALEIQAVCRRYGVPFVINDDVALAKEIDADGVHVGQDDMEAGDVRAILGADKIIGVSAHNVEEALRAERHGADYLGVGAAFTTSSKPEAGHIDAETIRAMVVDRCELPEGFDVSGYEMFQGQPSRVLHDGDKIELGGRSVEVLHTPGHSPGHMCFWEPDRRWLYTGDLVYADILLAYYPSTDPEAYLDSLERIAALQAERIFPAHHSLDVKPELVLRMRDALRELKARGELHHGSGVHNYGDWGIWL